MTDIPNETGAALAELPESIRGLSDEQRSQLLADLEAAFNLTEGGLHKRPAQIQTIAQQYPAVSQLLADEKHMYTTTTALTPPGFFSGRKAAKLEREDGEIADAIVNWRMNYINGIIPNLPMGPQAYRGLSLITQMEAEDPHIDNVFEKKGEPKDHTGKRVGAPITCIIAGEGEAGRINAEFVRDTLFNLGRNTEESVGDPEITLESFKDEYGKERWKIVWRNEEEYKGKEISHYLDILLTADLRDAGEQLPTYVKDSYTGMKEHHGVTFDPYPGQTTEPVDIGQAFRDYMKEHHGVTYENEQSFAGEAVPLPNRTGKMFEATEQDYQEMPLIMRNSKSGITATARDGKIIIAVPGTLIKDSDNPGAFNAVTTPVGTTLITLTRPEEGWKKGSKDEAPGIFSVTAANGTKIITDTTQGKITTTLISSEGAHIGPLDISVPLQGDPLMRDTVLTQGIRDILKPVNNAVHGKDSKLEQDPDRMRWSDLGQGYGRGRQEIAEERTGPAPPRVLNLQEQTAYFASQAKDWVKGHPYDTFTAASAAIIGGPINFSWSDPTISESAAITLAIGMAVKNAPNVYRTGRNAAQDIGAHHNAIDVSRTNAQATHEALGELIDSLRPHVTPADASSLAIPSGKGSSWSR